MSAHGALKGPMLEQQPDTLMIVPVAFPQQ
jgi:hypothetical protein